MKVVDAASSFSLDVLGYEFPERGDRYDANWLQIHIRASTGPSTWTAASACLLTWELVKLRDWISALRDGAAAKIFFIENDLAFRFDPDGRKLVVVLDYALHPNERSYRHGVDTECRLGFAWNERRRQEILSSLDALIARFPERAHLG